MKEHKVKTNPSISQAKKIIESNYESILTTTHDIQSIIKREIDPAQKDTVIRFWRVCHKSSPLC